MSINSQKMVQARYRNTGVTRYNGNPFIEALPPSLDDKKDIGDSLRCHIETHCG